MSYVELGAARTREDLRARREASKRSATPAVFNAPSRMPGGAIAPGALQKLEILKKSPVLIYNPAVLKYNKRESVDALKGVQATLGKMRIASVSGSAKQQKINRDLEYLESELNKHSLRNNRDVVSFLKNLPINEEQKNAVLDNPGTVVRVASASIEKRIFVDIIKRIRRAVKNKRPSNVYRISVDGVTKNVTVNPSVNQGIQLLLLQLACVSGEHLYETTVEVLAYAAEEGSQAIFKGVEDLMQAGAGVVDAVAKGLADAAKNTEKAVAAGVAFAQEAAADVVEASQQFVEGVGEAVEDFGQGVVSFFGLGFLDPVSLAIIVVSATVVALGVIVYGIIALICLVFGDFIKAFTYKAEFGEDMPPELYTDEATKDTLRGIASKSVEGAAGAAGALAGAAAVGAAGGTSSDVIDGLLKTAAQNGVQYTPPAVSTGPETSDPEGSIGPETSDPEGPRKGKTLAQTSSGFPMPLLLAAGGIGAFLILSKGKK